MPILLTNPTKEKLDTASKILLIQMVIESKEQLFANYYPEERLVLRHIAEGISEAKIQITAKTKDSQILQFFYTLCSNRFETLPDKYKNEITTIALILTNIQHEYYLRKKIEWNSSENSFNQQSKLIEKHQDILDPEKEFRSKVVFIEKWEDHN